MCDVCMEDMKVVLSYVKSHPYIRKVFKHFFGCAKSAVLIFVFEVALFHQLVSTLV